MSLEAIGASMPVAAGEFPVPAGEANPEVLSRFGTWFGQQLAEVNGQLHRADASLQHLALGDASNLHQVMINLEEARLSFQLLVQVRNRALEAYQEIIRMQV